VTAQREPGEDPAISVVVIGRNEGERLSRCLESVRVMTAPAGGLELIYVDSASRDDSVARARHCGARVVALDAARPCAAAGRNAGWRTARAPVVLFLDGDTVVDPRFVVDSLPEFSDPAVAVVWGHRRELAPRASLYNRALDLDWVYRPGPAELCGGDALVRRDALAAVDGFDETLIAGEEPDLCRRLRERGRAVLHVDRPMTRHDLAMRSFREYWRRALRAGHAYAEVAARSSGAALPLWRDVARRNRLHAIGLLAAPIAAGVAALALGTAWPLVAALALAVLLLARTAWRNRWKSDDPATLALYALHSHLQQLPIFAGQLAYALARLRGRRLALIEYRRASTSPQEVA
jgi:cellulose synthase/poly-beta-1,6-N-acetylglucosamine synthase-like glycosyltransferase